jgi:ribokinase
MSIVAYLRALTELGPKYVAVTDGARGAFVASRKEIIFSPALESKIVGTACAGDAFGATLTAYLALGYRLAEAVCAATANSASVVGHVDTQTGLLRREEIRRLRRGSEPSEVGPCSKSRPLLGKSGGRATPLTMGGL